MIICIKDDGIIANKINSSTSVINSDDRCIGDNEFTLIEEESQMHTVNKPTDTTNITNDTITVNDNIIQEQFLLNQSDLLCLQSPRVRRNSVVSSNDKIDDVTVNMLDLGTSSSAYSDDNQIIIPPLINPDVLENITTKRKKASFKSKLVSFLTFSNDKRK